jgi:magnesium transporter
LPGIVYLADAVGTQTETIVVRGLSLGIPTSRVAWRESLTGLLAGLILAVLFLPAALLLWGETRIAATVSISLFAACFIATLVGLVLPWALQKLGRDPAFGTGPLSTVIQDLCSIAVYLWAAELLVA